MTCVQRTREGAERRHAKRRSAEREGEGRPPESGWAGGGPCWEGERLATPLRARSSGRRPRAALAVSAAAGARQWAQPAAAGGLRRLCGSGAPAAAPVMRHWSMRAAPGAAAPPVGDCSVSVAHLLACVESCCATSPPLPASQRWGVRAPVLPFVCLLPANCLSRRAGLSSRACPRQESRGLHAVHVLNTSNCQQYVAVCQQHSAGAPPTSHTNRRLSCVRYAIMHAMRRAACLRLRPPCSRFAEHTRALRRCCLRKPPPPCVPPCTYLRLRLLSMP